MLEWGGRQRWRLHADAEHITVGRTTVPIAQITGWALQAAQVTTRYSTGQSHRNTKLRLRLEATDPHTQKRTRIRRVWTGASVLKGSESRTLQKNEQLMAYAERVVAPVLVPQLVQTVLEGRSLRFRKFLGIDVVVSAEGMDVRGGVKRQYKGVVPWNRVLRAGVGGGNANVVITDREAKQVTVSIPLTVMNAPMLPFLIPVLKQAMSG
jgi:hypothetical protein